MSLNSHDLTPTCYEGIAFAMTEPLSNLVWGLQRACDRDGSLAKHGPPSATSRLLYLILGR